MYSIANRRTRKGLIFSSALFGATLLAACGQTPAAAPPAPKAAPAVTVPAQPPHRADIRQLLTYSGDVRATQQISILPRGSGRVQQVFVDTGNQVKSGDMLAVLDQDGPRVQVQQARAALTQAE